MTLISLRNVSKTYGQKTVLRSVNLDINKGEFVLISGQSGSGKSTLLNIIGGIESLSVGEVIIDGKNMTKLKPSDRASFYRNQVGFIFQDLYLHPRLNVADNIALPGVFSNRPKAKRRQRVEMLAKALRIDDVLKNKPDQISGGQAQRVCAARAIFLSPKIILADEPTSSLDEKNAEGVLKMLKFIKDLTDATVIVSTHDPRVEKYATRVINVRDGEVL